MSHRVNTPLSEVKGLKPAVMASNPLNDDQVIPRGKVADSYEPVPVIETGGPSPSSNTREKTPLHPIEEESDEIPPTCEKTQRREDFKNKRFRTCKHKRERKPKIKPHAGAPSKNESVFRKHLDTVLTNLDVETLAQVLETFVSSKIIWSSESRVLQLFLTALEYAKIHMGSSMCGLLYNFIASKQLDLSFMTNWSLQDLVDFLKSGLLDWQSFKNHAGFKALSALLTYVVTFGLFEADTIDFSWGKFELLHIEALKSQVNARDFVDAIWKTMLFLAQSSQNIMVGDWRAILHSQDAVTEFENEYYYHRTQFAIAIAGNNHLLNDSSVHKWEKRLLDAIKLGHRVQRNVSGPTSTRISNFLKEMESMHAEFVQVRVSGDLREAPYSYLIYGSSSVGKSTLGSFLMRYLLEVNGFEHSSDFLATINGSDRFFSNFRSYILGVFFDDFGNVKAEFVERSPCNTLLEFVNNLPLYLVMAELNLKGKVTAEPKVVGITTNVWDLQAATYSNEPASILRRVVEHLHIKVKKEFQKLTQKEGKIRVELDPEKIKEKFPEMYNKERTTAFIADVWEIDIYNVEIYETQGKTKVKSSQVTATSGDDWKLVPAVFEGEEMKKISLKKLQEYVRAKSAIHYENQEAIVRNDKLANKPNVCKECKYATQFCECDKNSENSSDEISVISAPSDEESAIMKQSGTQTWAEYIQSSNEHEFRTDLQSCITTLVFEGKMNANKFRTALERHTSHAFILFLERVRQVGMEYCVKNGLNVWTNWLPEWMEDSPLGTYVNLKYRKNYVRALTFGDTCVQAARVGCGTVLPYLAGVPYQYVAALSLFVHRVVPGDLITRCVTKLITHPDFCFKTPVSSIANMVATRMYKHVWVKVVLSLLRKYDKEHKTNYTLKLIMKMKALRYFSFRMRMYLNKPGPKIALALSVFAQFPRIATICTVGHVVRSICTERKDQSMNSSAVIQKAMQKAKRTYPNVLRDKVIPSLATSAALYSGIPSAYQMVQNAHAETSTHIQSALDPSPEEIREKDLVSDTAGKFFEDKFARRIKDTIPTKIPMRNTEIASKVMKNLLYMRRESGHMCNAIMLTSGYLLMPQHMLDAKTSKFMFIRKANNTGKCGNATFEARIGSADTVRVGSHDLVVAYVPTSGDFTNILDLFSERTPEVSRTGKLYYRKKDGTMTISGVYDIVGTLTTNNHIIDGKRVHFPGIRYKSTQNFDGLCMAPVIADDKNSYIAGVHLGGDAISEARGGSPTPAELRTALSQLTAKSHIPNISSEGEFVTKQYGVDMYEDEIHKRSPLVLLQDDDRNFRCYGSTIGRATAKSAVVDTPIAGTVHKIYNVNKAWGPPKFRGPEKNAPWLPWATSLNDSTRPSIGFDGHDLARAADDYMNEISAKLRNEIEFWRKDVQVLNKDQIVNGIPKCRFIDKLVANTSVGAPLTGPKSQYLTRRVDPTGIYQDYDTLDDMFWKETERMESEYLSGFRCYPIFKAALKDEPTLVTKDKVRVFQAAPLAFQLLIRKYYLPVARFMSLNPLLTECAVGVNPISREWDELGKHISKYGKHRVLAIDYKKYDLRMPAQLTLCALKLMRRMAEICGYTPHDLKIMEGIATDICWPMSAYNGDLLMLIGSNPSGQNLTVYLNGIVNSLLHRMGFFHVYPNVTTTFRQCASLVTYGDDAAGSTKWWYNNYNMVTLRDFFAKHDITITMAEKDAAFRPYIQMSECDFLKRSFREDPEFGCAVGPLACDSIYKSLSSIVKSKVVSPEEVSAANLVGAADSFFLHGRETFNTNIQKLRQISRIHNLDHMTHALTVDFDTRLEKWKSMYSS